VEDQFANFPKAYPIVATTYNFDHKVIRDIICPRSGVHNRSIVLADANFFSEEAGSADFFNQGLTHFIYPACNIERSFHPKVALGVDEGLVRLLVGSHNLTEHGTKFNLEITGFYEIPLIENNTQVLTEISSFMQGLASCIASDFTAKKSILQMDNHIRDTHPSSMKLKTEDQFYFLHSFKKSIISQLIEIIPGINSTTICVPTFSEDANFIKESSHLLGGKLRFLVDPKNFPIREEAKRAYEKFEIEGLEIEDNRNLHAKIYFFHTKKGDWTLYGSPNFTTPALMKSVDKGGNVEAAILIAPSRKWNWKDLFKDRVSTIALTWKELQPSEENAEEEKTAVRSVDNWGYETPNNEAIISAPGRKDGETLYVRLFGISKLIEVSVRDGLLRFKVPAEWANDSRYEILDMEMKVIAKGFLNRSGAAMRELSEIDVSDASKIRLWFFMNRLRSFEPNRYDRFDTEIPLIPLDPGSWIDAKRGSPWSPISSRMLSLTPDQIFNSARLNFEEVWDKYYEKRPKIPAASRLRLVMIAMDIYIEGTFYAHVISGGSNQYFGQFTKDLSEFFGVPCAEDSRAAWNEEEWKAKYFEELNNDLIEAWRKMGAKIRLDVSLLLDFWLYFTSKSVGGFRAFERRPLDVPIMISRFYQVFQALRILIGQTRQDASFQKVWDDRIIFLESEKQLQKPSSFKYLQDCIAECSRLAAARL
jgi:hypothetical protein